MVGKYFLESFKALGMPNKLLQSIKKSTKDSLDRVFSRIRENFSMKEQDSYSSSEFSESPDELITDEKDGRTYIPQVSNKILVAKLTKERLEREKKKQEREEKARIKMMEEMQEIEKKKLQEMMLKEEEKQKRVNELVYKKEQRRKQIDHMREIGEKEFREIITNKPLFVKIEENYEEQVLMPELEKKKAELAKKREFFQPVRKQEIAEHMKRYLENSHENQARREMAQKGKKIEFQYNNSACIIKSKFTESILEEERRKKEEKEQHEQEKKILLEKKKNYASIVKEMFVPSIDEFKRQEMLLIQERLKHPVRIKIDSNNSISDEENRPRRKWKKNPLVPEKPPKREAKVVDYLAQKRTERGGSVETRNRMFDVEGLVQDRNLDKDEKLEKLRKKAKVLENESKKHERNIKSVSATDSRSLKYAYESDDLLLNSIRAKLAIINTNT